MTILKSIVVTASVFIITTLLELLILSFNNNLSIYHHIVALSEIIPGLISYIIVIAYFRFSKIDVSLEKVLIIRNYRILILIFIGLAVGDHLFDLPFFQWKNLSNKYFGTTLEIPNYSNYKFSIFQLYHGFNALIVAPFVEEIFFRYYIFGGLLKKYNFLTAILTSSILFAIIHIESPRNLIPAFVFGIISSIVYFRTQKISYSILLHFLTNGIWFVTVVFAKEYSQLIDEIGFGMLFWLVFLIGIFLLVIGSKGLTTTNLGLNDTVRQD